MAVLPSPFIQEKLSAQYGSNMKIPFVLNRAVNIGDFHKMQLKIKTVSTNIMVETVSSENIQNIGNGEYEVSFAISQDKYTIGQFYKAQIACISDEHNFETIGDFSSIGTFKYTAVPNVILLNSEDKEFQDFDPISNIFIGGYQTTDITEKVCEYRFRIYEEDGTLFKDSDFLIHNVANDIGHKDANGKPIAIDTYVLKKEMDATKNYYVIYSVKTVNGAIIDSKQYWMRSSFSISIFYPGTIKIRANEDEGYFALQSIFTKALSFSGSFKILRTDEHSGFSEWETLYQISFANKMTYVGEELNLFKDYTIEQNTKYKYAIQQYSGNLQTNKIECRILLYPDGTEEEKDYFQINFEDMFLYDGVKQLKIRFNPKVSSFKNVILENKLDTIGNQYPFFFRNGIVKYKEFPVSGLITRLMDDNNSFLQENQGNYLLEKEMRNRGRHQIAVDETKIGSMTDLTYDNIAKEREFKLAVLNWLTNGKPKLFRSPTEGNYIVRLMGVSLTPNDTLGRMIHTFQATAYEIADYNFENLSKNNFFDKETHYETDLHYENKNIQGECLLPNILSAVIKNANPGDIFSFEYMNGDKASITIGYTGIYNISIDNKNPLIKIIAPKNSLSILEYSFVDKTSSKNLYNQDNKEMTNFKTFNKIDQYIGDALTEENDIVNIISQGDQSKGYITQIESIPFLRLQAKLPEYVWSKNENGKISLHKDKFCSGKYLVQPRKTVIYYSNNEQLYYYCDQSDNIKNAGKEPDYNYIINNKQYYLGSGRIEMNLVSRSKDDKIVSIQIGNGIYADIFYYASQYQLVDQSN